MNIFINKQQKKILVLEILFVSVIILLIIINAYLLLNPRLNQVQTRDDQRVEDLNTIISAIEEYIDKDEGAKNFLDDIELCVNGNTEIGEGNQRIDLKSVLASYTDNEFKDPIETDETYSGYDICRSFDGYRFVLKAPRSELNDIEITKRINSIESNN